MIRQGPKDGILRERLVIADGIDGSAGLGGFKDGHGASCLNAMLYEDGNE